MGDPSPDVREALYQRLLAEQIHPGNARRLVETCPPERIERQLAWIDKREQIQARPAALARAIEQDWGDPARGKGTLDPAGPLNRGKYYTGAYGVCRWCGCKPCAGEDCPGEPEEDQPYEPPPPIPLRPVQEMAPPPAPAPKTEQTRSARGQGASRPGERTMARSPDPPEEEPGEPIPPTDPARPMRFRRLRVPYTQVPHIVFGLPVTHDLDPSQQAVLNQIVRQTYGYHYEQATLSTMDLAKAANVSYPTCRRALAELQTKGLITRTRQADAKGHREADLITLTLPGVEVE